MEKKLYIQPQSEVAIYEAEGLMGPGGGSPTGLEYEPQPVRRRDGKTAVF